MARASYQIFTDKLGARGDIPGVLVDERFIAEESRNIHTRFGEYRRVKGRLPELFDADGVQIAAPVFVDAITAVDQGNKKFTISGNHKAAIDAAAVDSQCRINGSTGNDTVYTMSTVTDVGADTEIVVAESIADGTVDGNFFVGATPVIEFLRHVLNSIEYLILGTKNHILLWGQAARTLTVKFTTGTPASVERWEIISHLKNVYATNNVDKVQWYNIVGSVGNNFAALDNAAGIDIDGVPTRLTKAKHIASHEGYLFLGYTTEGGAVFPRRIRASSLNTPDDFDENGAGDAFQKNFENSADEITGFGKKARYIVVAKERSMHRGWLTPDDVVFDWKEELLKVGCLSADTLVNDPAGRLYWLASDFTIRELDTPFAISEPLKKTLLTINASKAKFSQMTYIDELVEMWLSAAFGDSDTNNQVVAYDTTRGKMSIYEFAIRAFGDFTRQAVVEYDELIYETYAEWGAAWLIYDTNVNVVGFPLDLASDYSGFTYDLHSADKDAGNDFTGTLIFHTTLTGAKQFNQFKRVNNGLDPYFNAKDDGTVAISVKKDSANTYTSLGSVSLINANFEIATPHLSTDFRAKEMFFKLAATATTGTSSNMEFLGMLIQNFEFDGDK